KATFSRVGGMCPRCEGMGQVTDLDLAELYDEGLSLQEGPVRVPGYSAGGGYGKLLASSAFFPVDTPIRSVTERPLPDFVYKARTKVRIDGANMTYEGLIPKIQKSMLSKDRDSMQPHIRAFVDRAVTFIVCPDCEGTRLAEHARTSLIDGRSIADVCAMQISDHACCV